MKIVNIYITLHIQLNIQYSSLLFSSVIYSAAPQDASSLFSLLIKFDKMQLVSIPNKILELNVK